MENFNKIVDSVISAKKKEIENTKNSIRNSRVYPVINYDKFTELFVTIANKEILRNKQVHEFEVDLNTTKVLRKLHQYFTGQSKEMNVYKGIILLGDVGTGKTLIMKTFVKIVGMLIFKTKIETLHAKEIDYILKKERDNNTIFYSQKSIFIDDIGKENQSVNNYGTKTNPIIDLFTMRSHTGTSPLTFATANYNENTLVKFYGKTIVDRFKETFNFITLEGNESKRKIKY